ncbi:extracellular solute-binding protein [Patescibacteria group bacterium]|nr:extracellular solute-binding protein [Patescibacteria group bacterium]MBU1890580.1 extracellular solute-binding protein [Patescibacteria group bacterium]
MKFHLSYKLLFFICLLGSVVLLGGVCDNSSNVSLKKVELTIWRVWDEEDAFEEIFDSYRAAHPNVTFVYKKLRYEEYKEELLSAWARGEGPDIFSLPNQWMGEYLDLITPLPPELEIPRIVTKKVLGFKEERREVRDKVKTYTVNNIRSLFASTVVDDVVFYDKEGASRIYGLPYSIDNLALYYNRDILDQSNIPLPPRTWDELLTQIPKLVRENSQNEITQSGIALGTVDNIQRYFDILSLLMVQDGTSMGSIDQNNRFRSDISERLKIEEGGSFYPGAHALTFYTDFSNVSKQSYSWNVDLPNAFEAFTQGQLAYYLGYSYSLSDIKEIAPRLNFDVAPIPQASLNQEVNYANYWVDSVYANSENATWAWDFLVFATKKENVVNYLNNTKRPSALREIISLQLEQDPEIEVFVNQALTSANWYHGKDYTKTEDIFSIMINSILDGTSTSREAVEAAEKMINQNEKLKE